MNKKGKCPLFENISAFCDNELDTDGAEYKHIVQCEECLKKSEIIASLSKKITLCLEQSKEKIDSGKLESKILAVVRKTQGQGSINFLSYGQVFLRASAVFAILGIAIFYVSNLMKDTEKNRRQIDSAKIANETQKKSADNDISRGNFNSLDFGDIKKAGAGLHEDDDETTKILFNQASDKTVAISSHVNHVWLWDKGQMDPPDLNIIFKKSGILPKDIKETQKGEIIEYSVLTRSLNVIKLVRALNAAGYKLLRDTEPQPESVKFSGSPENPTLYEFSLTRL